MLASCASGNGPQQTWELMVPPPSKGAVYGYDPQAPLKEWERFGDTGFASDADCENFVATTLREWNEQSGWSRNASEGTFDSELDRLRAGVCVTIHDPRLHGNQSF